MNQWGMGHRKETRKGILMVSTVLPVSGTLALNQTPGSSLLRGCTRPPVHQRLTVGVWHADMMEGVEELPDRWGQTLDWLHSCRSECILRQTSALYYPVSLSSPGFDTSVLWPYWRKGNLGHRCCRLHHFTLLHMKDEEPNQNRRIYSIHLRDLALQPLLAERLIRKKLLYSTRFTFNTWLWHKLMGTEEDAVHTTASCI